MLSLGGAVLKPIFTLQTTVSINAYFDSNRRGHVRGSVVGCHCNNKIVVLTFGQVNGKANEQTTTNVKIFETNL